MEVFSVALKLCFCQMSDRGLEDAGTMTAQVELMLLLSTEYLECLQYVVNYDSAASQPSIQAAYASEDANDLPWTFP